MFLVHGGATPWARRLAVPTDELAALDPSVTLSPVPPDLGDAHHDPIVLVCTHAKRDACCAERGGHVARAVAAMRARRPPGRPRTPAATGSPPSVILLPVGARVRVHGRGHHAGRRGRPAATVACPWTASADARRASGRAGRRGLGADPLRPHRRARRAGRGDRRRGRRGPGAAAHPRRDDDRPGPPQRPRPAPRLLRGRADRPRQLDRGRPRARDRAGQARSSCQVIFGSSVGSPVASNWHSSGPIWGSVRWCGTAAA